MISFIRSENRFWSDDQDDETSAPIASGRQSSPMPVASQRRANRARHRARARRPRPRMQPSSYLQ